jgi:hypothetical protein
MYNIQKTSWGYEITFGDTIKAPEMQKWHEESVQILATAKPEFGVFVDMRTLKPLAEDAKSIMEAGQRLYKAKGMVRSVVILASKLLTLQFQRIAAESGIDQWERYVDSTSTPNWHELGVAWVRDGVEHESLRASSSTIKMQ